jgi:hypothetical protein
MFEKELSCYYAKNLDKHSLALDLSFDILISSF